MTRSAFSRSLLSAAVAGALCVSAAAVPASAQVTPVAATDVAATASQPGTLNDGDLKYGTMSWPIKESYLNYVQGFAGGKITVSDGVVATQEGEKVTGFTFPIDPAASTLDAQGNGTLALLGTISILGHEGLGANGGWGMDLTYSNFAVRITEGTKAEILADYEVKGSRPGASGGQASGTQETIATFDLGAPLAPQAGATKKAEGRVPTLAQGGQASLQSYKAGEKLNDGAVDLSVTFARSGDAPVEPEVGAAKTFDHTEGSALNKKTLVGAGVGLAVILALLGAIGAWIAGLIPGLEAPQLALPF